MMVGDVVEGIPVEARVRTAKGAEAFVRYYLDVLNDVMQHPRAGRLESLSTAGCKSCIAFSGEVDRLVKLGGRYVDQPLMVLGVAGADGLPESDATYRVIARAEQRRSTIVDVNATVLETVMTKKPVFIFEISWAKTWRAKEIRLVAGSEK